VKGFWTRLKLFTRLQKGPGINGICSPEEFRAIIERECMRADRTNLQLSLVVFNLINTNSSSDGAEELKSVLCRRIRITDEVGWFDEKSIGTILPDTTTEGAWKFAGDICRRVATIAKNLNCMVYTYPSKWLPHENKYFKQMVLPGILHELGKALFQGLFSDKNPAPNGYIASEVLTSGTKLDISKRPVERLELLLVRRFPIRKRIIDIIGTIIALIIFSPVMLAVAAAIKLTSSGPIIFSQERVGLMGKKFNFHKFRSMYTNSSEGPHKDYIKKFILEQKSASTLEKKDEGGIYKLKDDPRMTPLGMFLRKSSLDELPQFFNVLKGEMSLVGPRPPIPYECEHYDTWHNRRILKVRPGITGLWQIQGRSSTSFNEMVRLDLKYIREWSLKLDLKILFQTPRAVLSGKGAY
jgi:lipopolysaccharide/colanic/teichoic acid biosynthesis glycosyltransferase